MHPFDPDYNFFSDYYTTELADLAAIEQLTLLDDEIANKTLIGRYLGPIPPDQWPNLEARYDELFTEFVTDRIAGMVDVNPIRRHRNEFHAFRKSIARLNHQLTNDGSPIRAGVSRPAERLLLKGVRRGGFDPSDIDVSYVERGGGLYLLELFITAAHQQADTGSPLLTKLIEQAEAISQADDRASELLSYPVLMVDLWDNQRNGLDAWIEHDREGILEMATATGKTVAGIGAIAHLCGDFPEDPTQTPETEDAEIMIVAHSNAILKQWEREIREKLGLSTMEQGEGTAQPIHFETGQIEFHTAHWLLPQYERDLADEYDLVIYDEVHHYANESGFGAAIQRPNYRAALGLSATIGDGDSPKRRAIEEILAPVVYTYGLQDARADGIIPDFEWTVHPTALAPYEKTEWDKTTDSISNQFTALQNSETTTRILRSLGVPFSHLRDLGDFIQAYQAAEIHGEVDVPDSWSNLQAAIQSRTWIRHRSRPKLDRAIELAADYLADPSQPVKLVVFAMDIETTETIADALRDVSDDVYLAHSQLESSSSKNAAAVQRNIDRFAATDHGVLVSPQLLDEGIDIPDAEVGINVAGTKTKLQLVQRMGRVLRKHGDQKPHFHHFIAMPDEQYLHGLDSKELVQELNWVRELGETIGQQPTFEEAHIDEELLERAQRRGNELWAQDLLNDLDVETVQGTLHLDQIVQELTPKSVDVLLERLDFDTSSLAQADWEAAMDSLRDQGDIPVQVLQQIWWLFPIYRDRPGALQELLGAVQNTVDSTTPSSSSRPSNSNKDTSAPSPQGSSESTPGPEVVFDNDPTREKSPARTRDDASAGESIEDQVERVRRLVDHQSETLPDDLPIGVLERLCDVVELSPTKNAELMERWNLENGSEVHRYLERRLGRFYYRGEDKLIRPSEEAVSLIERIVTQ